ncbi:MAG TPA: metallophosphatase domain-containing protein [Edaphobacter sp.]|nr:metallophosphatase domain-containing protein [Edaphobacter sp.]
MNSKAESENRASTIRLVLMSDTHGHHRDVKVPGGDLLVHAGDFTFFNGSTFAIQDFNDWLGQLPHRSKVLIPGNHDSGFVDPAFRELITEATLLINEGTVMQGIRIWGSPCTPNDWGVFGPATDREREALFSRIPEDTDILITHGPLRGILDRASRQKKSQGCDQLLAAVRRVRPRLHVFGHIHQEYGMLDSAGTLFVNAALAGPDYAVTKRPVEFEMPLRRVQ